MKKTLEVLSFVSIGLAILVSLCWAGVELAIYYGSNLLFTNPVFNGVFKAIIFIRDSAILPITIALITGAVVFTAVGSFIFAAHENAKKLKYLDALDYQLDKNAAFYDKTFDDKTPVSMYENESDLITNNN